MGRFAARQDDRIKGTDLHLIQPPSTAPAVLKPHPFDGRINDNLSPNVNINGSPAAMRDSTARNEPEHVPQGGSFVKMPTNRAIITTGSRKVRINGRPAARDGDEALTCNDPMDAPVGKVVVLPRGRPVRFGE